MIAAMAPRAILLDALGTLVDLEPPVPVLIALMRERHGVEIAPDDARRAMAAEMAHYREWCIRAADAASLAALRRECAEIVARALGAGVAAADLEPTLLDSLRFRAFPEAPAALARWRAAGVRLVVASNWDVSLHAVLAQIGLRELLDGVTTSAEVGVAKPGAELFEAALAIAGVPAAAALHVGDSLEADVAGALGAGIAAAWLRRAPGAGRAPDGVPVIASLDELVLAP